jgi:hypothetical protein
MGSFGIPNFAGGYGSGGSGSDMINMGQFNPGGGGGQNQWMSYPSMGYSGGSASTSYTPPTTTYGGGYSGPVPPGVVPPQGSPYPSPGSYPYNANLTGRAGAVGSSTTLPGNYYGAPTVDPLFTQGYAGYLSGQLGTGISPYNLSAFLPSTGGSTGLGQVGAPLTPELQQLEQFFQTGQGGGPGMQSLSQMAQTGDPINQTPAWEAMVASEQQNITKGGNQLKEQFAGMGDLNSTVLGSAIGDYYSQAQLGENAQLTQATTQAQEAAAGRQLGAGEFLNQGAQQMGQFLQSLDQQSISNLMNEYFMTQPQNNPLLALEAQFAGEFPPVYGSKGFGAGLESSLAAALGTSLGTFGMSAGGGTPATFGMGAGG